MTFCTWSTASLNPNMYHLQHLYHSHVETSHHHQPISSPSQDISIVLRLTKNKIQSVHLPFFHFSGEGGVERLYLYHTNTRSNIYKKVREQIILFYLHELFLTLHMREGLVTNCLCRKPKDTQGTLFDHYKQVHM